MTALYKLSVNYVYLIKTLSMKLKPIQTIHLAFCIGILMFATVTLIINKESLYFNASFEDTAPFNPIFPLIAVISVFAGSFLYVKQIAKLAFDSTFDQKITGYQTALLIKFAFCEAGALLNIIGFFVTNNVLFMCFAAFSFVALAIARPNKDKAIKDLQLQYPDTERL